MKTIARTTVLGEIMTRKKKCNSKSNSFAAAAEQVRLQHAYCIVNLPSVFTLHCCKQIDKNLKKINTDDVKPISARAFRLYAMLGGEE